MIIQTSFKKYLALNLILGLFLLSGCEKIDKSDNKDNSEHSVEYYLANPELAKSKVKYCESEVATISDHEEIFSEGDCRNALLAKKQISKKWSSSSNKPTPFGKQSD